MNVQKNLGAHINLESNFMQIFHIVQSLDPESGGPPVVVTRLASAQASLGHKVTIISYDDPANRQQLEAPYNEISGFEKVEIILAKSGAYRFPFWDPYLFDLLASKTDSETIFHLHGVWDAILLLASSFARRKHIPYMIAPHGMLDSWSLATKKWKKKLALALFYRAMLKNAGSIHVLNTNERTQVDRLGLNVKTEIIPNGVNLEELQIPSANVSSPHRTNGDYKPYILFLGRLHYKKGLDYLAVSFSNLAKRYSDIDLVVAGPDYGERESFEKLVAKFGIEDRVHLIGPVQGSRKIEILTSATCFCLPSRSEGFSVAILEALACGVPVVISESCYFPEVEHAGAGSVVKLDANEIGDALFELVTNNAKLDSSAEAARKLVANHYTWPILTQKTLACYHEILSRG